MPRRIPVDLPTLLAWRFTGVLPGTFQRNNAQLAHLAYPILNPLPSNGRQTKPLQHDGITGAIIYFVRDSAGLVRYVGKSQEDEVIHRWVRPGIGGPASHYWTHSTASGGVVFKIAHGLSSGASPTYELHYVRLSNFTPAHTRRFGLATIEDAKRRLAAAEAALINELSPDWNKR